MSHDKEKHENVVSLAEARRRQRTVQKAANGRYPDGPSGRAGAQKGQAKGKVMAPTGLRKVWGYVQLILFLAVLAYMMQLCKGRA